MCISLIILQAPSSPREEYLRVPLKNSRGSNSRFFEEEDRSGRFTPGRWSKRLLEAMGVRSNETPPFVYRMRVLGYPPGWLSEAEETNSGLKLFDGSGKEGQFLESHSFL